jgi:hypothetical protein
VALLASFEITHRDEFARRLMAAERHTMVDMRWRWPIRRGRQWWKQNFTNM